MMQNHERNSPPLSSESKPRVGGIPTAPQPYAPSGVGGKIGKDWMGRQTEAEHRNMLEMLHPTTITHTTFLTP